MTVLAANTARKVRNTKRRLMGKYPVKGSTLIYAGALVCVAADGYAVNAADTAGLKCVGICKKKVDNSAGADGAKTVEVYYGHEELFTVAAGITVADIHAQACVVDNDSLTDAAAATNDVEVGDIVEVPASGTAWVAVCVASANA